MQKADIAMISGGGLDSFKPLARIKEACHRDGVRNSGAACGLTGLFGAYNYNQNPKFGFTLAEV